ncbi:MAG: helix-turn-helix transcriptional regulator [Clostridia bacterium]|nr:helix-turn-helix transcriptional regulator [Clostridia bacterium]
MENYNVIKQRLTKEIKESGYKIKEIALKVGVSPEMITQYCTTDKLPKLDTFAKLCKELDLDANYILGLSD